MSGVDVTVAIATCGRPTALERCLIALAAGSAGPHELIVVDQAPTAAARAVVAASDAGARPARYLEQPRLGLSASRNLALAAASGPILAVTDDDCAPEPGWLATIAAAFARGPAPAAVTGPIVPLGPRPPGTESVSLRDSAVPVDHEGAAVPWTVGSGANFAAPRSVLQDVGGWDERLGTGSPGRAAEDADLVYRILKHGGVVRYEPAARVAHAWQTRRRRRATRWSYGYGVGALCGLWLRRGDPFAVRMLAAYLRLHLGPSANAVRRRDGERALGGLLALASVPPGLSYGLRAGRRAHADDARHRAQGAQ